MLPIPLPKRRYLNEPLETPKTDEEILKEILKRMDELEEEPINEEEEIPEDQKEFFEGEESEEEKSKIPEPSQKGRN
jgi:hypothetical protein